MNKYKLDIDILTLFPQQIDDFTQHGLLNIAQKKGLVRITAHNIRDWSNDKHRRVDDRPFGGGAGMLMKIEPIHKALQEIRRENSMVIITAPSGETWTQDLAKEMYSELFSSKSTVTGKKVSSAGQEFPPQLIIIAGHYEGIDHRVHEYLVDREISIGDYVLSGGELPSLVIVDTLTRLVPGVLGNAESLQEESFEGGLIEYPQYTRPAEYNGWSVPEVLLNGNHARIKEWRNQLSQKKSLQRNAKKPVHK